jgi:hypothetical protein
LNGGIVAMSGLDGGSRGDVESSKSRDCTDPSTGFDFFIVSRFRPTSEREREEKTAE